MDFFLQAYIIGWSVAAPIGPVNIEIIRRALRYRLLAGFLVGVGATMVDLTYMLLTGFGITPLLQVKAVLLTCYAVGGVLLALLAGLATRDGVREWKRPMEGSANAEAIDSDQSKAPLMWRHWLVGLAMTAANPMTIAFWATLPGLLFGAESPSPARVLSGAAFVWLGTISWVSLLMVFLAAGRRFARHKLLAIASIAGGVAMAYFAAKFLWLAVGTVAGG